jgi:MFS family permease
VTSDARTIEAARSAAPRVAPLWRTRAWAITGALSITETVSYGILYYAFAAFLVPMHEDLGWSTAQLTGAFSLAILISAIAGIAVGRYLDNHGPRGLMTVGALAGALLVLGWSRVDGLVTFYAVWIGIGLVMAAVLYEAAFTVLAKHFAAPAERRRAMTAMTLVAALASFIFVPLSQALIDAYGWRDALVILAATLAAVTVPLHALVLRQAPAADARAHGDAASAAAAQVLRMPPFWMLSGAFFLAQFAGIGTIVLAIPFLLERGHNAEFAALAVGLFGISQIPGRVVFAPLAGRVSPAWSTALVFGLIAAGIAVVVAIDAPTAVVAGFVVLGMGNGMATLARATILADRYGQAAYGTITGVAASVTIAARAAAPVAAAAYAAAVGYPALFWTLAAVAAVATVLGYRAEI